MMSCFSGESAGTGHKKHPVIEQLAEALKGPSSGAWPLLLGGRGVGKSAAVRAAIRTSRGGESHELFEVSVSSYSVKELFGWEREGKWHFGIITNFLTGAQTGGQVASLQPCNLYTSV